MKYLSIIIMLFIGCTYTPKLECYRKQLTTIKNNKNYQIIMMSAKEILPRLMDTQLNKPIIDSTYIVSALLDDATFFNPDTSKCLLLVLEKTSNDLNLDQVRILQGTKKDSGWIFSQDRMPNVPSIIYTIDKKDSSGVLVNNSFNVLSEKGRAFVLNAGTVKRNNCLIDILYWFGE